MKRSIRVLAVLLTAVAVPVLATAQDSTVGTLVIAHGGGPEWDDQVKTVAEMVSTGGPVEVSFLMGTGAAEHRFQDAARKLVEQGADEIVVVPLLVSSHSSHYEQIRWLAGETEAIDPTMLHHLQMSGIERADVDVPLHLAPALDDAPELAQVLAERALEVTPTPRFQTLYLLGHGPNDDAAYSEWMNNLRPVAEKVKELTGFIDVKVGLVRDDAPEEVRAAAVAAVREEIQAMRVATNQPVVVVPVLISTGTVSQQKFPADLRGLAVMYTGATLLPHPGMAEVIEARVREAVQ